MKSIRTKMTLLTVCAIVIALVTATLLGVFAIRDIGRTDSDRILMLLCEAGEKNLDSYFESIEQSVEMVSAYVDKDLTEVDLSDDAQFRAHLDRVRDIFSKMSKATHGVLTYYYRIDPEVSAEKGFWYVDLDGEGFVEHEPTEISLYDTNDTSQLVWFTVPKATGEPVWQPPYITDNLDVRVLSYNCPVYKDGIFVGVAGIEIDFTTMAEQVDHITLYENGYAFINDPEGNLIYHPRMDVTTLQELPQAPEGLLWDAPSVRYRYEGVEKLAVWRSLSNGMRLNVCVPMSEINAGWHSLIRQNVLLTIVLLAVFILIMMHFTGSITRPLLQLTEVAEKVNSGDYECALDYKGNDEVGILTKTFNNLTASLKTYIHDLNDLAYADALTGVHNKGAYDIYIQKMEIQLQESEKEAEFAICIFDCNNLKAVNDHYGHDKGNIYLKLSCALICKVFDHSPVFRVGGDEFAAILQKKDYIDREELIAFFDQSCKQSQTEENPVWERINIARGIAVYDKENDYSVNDVVRRADKLMYENKWESKEPSV